MRAVEPVRLEGAPEPRRHAPGVQERAVGPLALQRAAGNRATSQLIGRLQTQQVQRENGRLQVPAGQSQRFFADPLIGLSNRAEGGADLVLFLRDTELIRTDVHEHSNGNLVPMLAQWSERHSDERLPVRAKQGQVAKRFGDWLEPLDPRFRANYIAVGSWTDEERAQHEDQGAAIPPSARLTLGRGTIAAVPADAVRQRTLTADLPAEAEFRQRGEKLFPRPPTLDDIKQVGMLADCGLLAALAAVLARDPTFPESIMRDNGDGTVSVKLFDIVIGPGGVNQHVPRYVVVQKSTAYVKGTNDEAFAGGSLWVPILEKAYVAAGYLGSGKGETDVRTYANIAQGSVAVAFAHLTGSQGQEHDVEGLPEGAPKRGSGAYTDVELDLFDRIKAAVDGGQRIVVETRDVISGGEVTERGKSGGEAKVKGLAGGHAYTVLDYAPRDGGNGSKTVRLRNPWPSYGRSYLSFTDEQGTRTRAMASPGREFDLDLRDLAKRFRKVTTA
jgi:hypothetical protein